MPPDLSTNKIEEPPVEPVTPKSTNSTGETQRWKYRARFRKMGDLRFVSHHDLMHVVERMFRRADMRLAVTQGFNPHPKMTFALSLALGVVGLHEVLEFETAEPIAAEEIERRLQRQCPPGLEIVSVRSVDFRTSARVRRALYRVSLAHLANAGGSLEEFLASKEHWINRQRPQPRRINVRPFVHKLALHENHIEMALWITPNGAARPEEVITALGLADVLVAGAVIERIELELYDELPPGAEPAPAIEAAFQEITTNDKGPPPSDRPTAIFDSPMSFDT